MLYITVEEAGELAPREHELGACGTAVVHVYRDGRPSGIATSGRPSFPRPRWGEVLEVSDIQATETLALVLVDADAMQQRAGGAFVFGFVPLSATILAAAHLGQEQRLALQKAPGGQGFLSFKVDRTAPRTRHIAALQGPDLPSVVPGWQQPEDVNYFCGVLAIAACTPCPEKTLVEVSVGSRCYNSWMPAEAKGPQRLLLVDREPELNAHITVLSGGGAAEERSEASGRCRTKLVEMQGAVGKTSLLLDPRPPLVTLTWDQWHSPAAVAPPMQLQLRFFPADFLDPGFQFGLRVTIELYMSRSAAPLPLLLEVPAQCFGSTVVQDEEAKFYFELAKVGDQTTLCFPDPLRLIGHSLWRLLLRHDHLHPGVSNNQAVAAQQAVSECLIDFLALRMRLGSSRTLTVPAGHDMVILRVATYLYDPHVPTLPVPSPAGHIDVPSPPPGSLAGLEPLGQGEGEVVGVIVHSLAVHSPTVSQCMLCGGPQLGTTLTLPHHHRVFVAAQASSRMRLEINAALPEHGAVAAAEVLVGDGPLEARWRFAAPSGDVHAVAMVTCVRLPSSWLGLSAMPLALKVLTEQIPSPVAASLRPMTFTCGGGATFVWNGPANSAQEDLLPFSTLEPSGGFLNITVGGRSHAGAASSFILPALCSIQRARHKGYLPLFLACVSRRVGVAQARRSLHEVVFVPVELRIAVESAPSSIGIARGVLVLQSFSVCAALHKEAHANDCPLRWRREDSGSWEATSVLGLVVDGLEAHSSARVQAARHMGVAWVPPPSAGVCFTLLPHVVKAPFDSQHGALSFKVDFHLSCPRCGKQVSLCAEPPSKGRLKTLELPTWRAFDVHLQVAGSGRHTLHRGACAAARVVLCGSAFTASPYGLLSLRLAPLQSDGPGVMDVLRQLAGRSPASGTPAARVAVGGALAAAPDAVLILDEQVSADSEQLHVRTQAGDELKAVTLELLQPNGSRRMLATVCLSLLGVLANSDTKHPLLIAPGIGLLLVARYAAADSTQGSPALLPGDNQEAPPASTVSSAKAELAAEAGRLRGLMPMLEAEVQGRAADSQTKGPSRSASAGASRASSGRQHQQQHPFRERGKHLWVASRGHKVTPADRYWWQELDRARPSHGPERGPVTFSADGPPPLGLGTADGWDEERDKAEGPSYRAGFLSTHREAVHALRQELHRTLVEVRKAEDRLSHGKLQLATVERTLAAESKGSKQNSTSKLSGFSKLAPSRAPLAAGDGEPAVCSRCGKLAVGEASDNKRYCRACITPVIEHAGTLQDEVAAMLAERSMVYKDIESKSAEARALALQEAELRKRAANADSADAEVKKQQQVLEVLTQLATLRRSRKPRSELEAVRLEALKEQIAEAEAKAQASAANLQEAADVNAKLKQEMEAIRKEMG